MYLAVGAPLAVARRQHDGAETVDGDAEDGVDGAEADGEVEREPEVAEQFSEHPALSGEQVDRVERHRDGADDEVADGQRRDEVVGRLTQRALKDEREQHDQVAADRRQTDARRQQSHHRRHQHRPPAVHVAIPARRRARGRDRVTSGHIVRPRDLWRNVQHVDRDVSLQNCQHHAHTGQMHFV